VEGDMSVLNRLEKRLKGKEEPRLTQRLTIRLDERTYKALEELAQEHNLAVSELAREVLVMLADEHLAKRQKE
jgi:predicted DNA-binding ribbon-helix-helix protein